MSALSDKYADPQYYHNRELSWLQFDKRCLSEAKNPDNPLFEKLKFLSITASNLDEFFMVRVGSLQDMVNAGYKKRDIAGMTASEQLEQILKVSGSFIGSQYTVYRQLVPDLRENGLDIVENYKDLTEAERGFVNEFFETEVFPVLTPMAVDNARPFPLVRNKSLNLCALLARKEGTGQGISGYMRKPKKSGKDQDILEWALQSLKENAGEEEKAGPEDRNGSEEGGEPAKEAARESVKTANKDVKQGAIKTSGKEAKQGNVKNAGKEAKQGNVKAAGKEAKQGNVKNEGKDSKAGKEKDKEKDKDKNIFQFATVQVPSVLPRILELPDLENEGKELSPADGEKEALSAAAGTGKAGGLTHSRRVIFLEEIIRHHLGSLFLNYDVLCAYPYRVTRNADLTIDEDDASDLLEEIEKQLKKRQRGYAIRLEIEDGMDPRLLSFLKKEFKVPEDRIFKVDGPLDLTFLMKLYGLDGFEWLRENRYAKPQENPRLPAGCNVFEEIKKGDIFLHHPYQTFRPVVDFVAQAADDPGVLAIKQTLYRVSGNSPIVKALARAAENGKQVTVLVELKARFDEENNIIWAKMLERAGCHVIYGLAGLKTHSKITLVVRREDDGIRRYVHLATGNYNDSTAKLYTDIGIMTCRDDIGEDATSAFNMLSGYSEPRSWNRLALAPLWLKDRFLYLILREAQHARRGEKAKIKAKMNSLCDPDIMAALYEASCAGVKIDLIVRGICCLKVGIPGISQNIRVRSIVGNFLEHSRIFYFENAGRPELYAASADWMPRNLDRRVEILFPIEDREIAKKAAHILEVEFADNVKAHKLKNDGHYERNRETDKEPVDSQRIFCEEAVREAQALAHPRGERVFIPAERKE